MVTFKGWLIKAIRENCCLLKIRRGNCDYSIPYERPVDDSFFDDNWDTLTLQNLVSNDRDVISLSDVFNVEIYSMNQYEISRKSMAEHIENKYSPILSYKFQNLTRKTVLNLMFLDGITLNYLKIMDFMEYQEPEDFSKVKFVGIRDETVEVGNVARKNFSLIVNKRMETVKKDMISALGIEGSSDIRLDIEKNVSEFITGLSSVPTGKLQDIWPTLLNPSPYYFLPNVVNQDG
jgi:hypothetical protein